MILADSSTAAGGAIGGLIFLCALLAAYMIPTIVAHVRHVKDFGSVVVVNVLLGWTFIGWVVALAMAMRTPPVTDIRITKMDINSAYPQNWQTPKDPD
jgi:cell division protein FtsW (lipid II flippase)